MKKISLIFVMLLVSLCFGLTDLDILLNGDFASSDGWVTEANWSISGGVATLTSTGDDNGHKISQAVSLVEGAVYNVTITSSAASYANIDTYTVVSLGGGSGKQITQNETVTVPLICGSSPSSGIEFVIVNDTSGDTITLDNISVKPQYFSPSINTESLFVCCGKVPAGAQILTNNSFATWAGVAAPGDYPTGWTLYGNDATNYVEESPADSLHMVSDGAVMGIYSSGALTAGKEYFVRITISSITGAVKLTGSGTILTVSTTGTHTAKFVANGANLQITRSGTCDVVIDSVELYELTNGPTGQYDWDSGTDYSGGEEDTGYYNGEMVFKSTSLLPNGAGSTAYWYLRQRVSNGYWYLTATSPVTSDDASQPRWRSSNLLGSYIDGSTELVPSYGTVTVAYGPQDVTIPSLTGQNGLKTNGSSGYVNLRTSYDYLNDLRAGKFAIVAVFNVDKNRADWSRIVSAETSANTGFYIYSSSVADKGALLMSPTLTTGTIDIVESQIHSFCEVFDVGNTNAYFCRDGEYISTDSSVSGLDVCQNSLLRLGSYAYAVSGLSKSEYGLIAILDLSSVTTVDAAFATNLSAVINNAALVHDYDPVEIANAIYNLDNNIAGVYYPLNEADVGDASSYYLLAYDITDDSAKTSDFYGLVSPSGVAGEVIYVDQNVRPWLNK